MNAVTLPTVAEQPIRISSLTSAGAAAWDAFVHAHPQGTFFHLSGWKVVLERAFGHATHYLVATGPGGVQGVLPLARVRSWVFGDALISTPFCVYGGALASSPEVRVALEDAACALASDLNVDYLELRHRERLRPEWPSKELYVTFRKAIDPNPDANLAAVPRKHRAEIRKGIASELMSDVDWQPDQLYRVYSDSLRNLGTPVFARRYLDVLREVFGEQCEILTAKLGDEVLSAVLSFYFRDEVLPYYGGGSARARDWRSNDFMYWELMRRGSLRGLRLFDFGRSKQDTGSYKYKKHWGFEPEQLHYEYHLVRAQRLPDLSPANPRYQKLIGIWKRLPLWITQLIGPPVARHLG